LSDYVFRPATWDDLDAFYNLYRMEHLESYGNFGMTPQEVGAFWDYPGFDIAEHTCYVFTAEGQNIAYAELRVWRDIPVRPLLYAYVHPEHRSRGIGSRLTEWGIRQSACFLPKVPDHARVVLGAFSSRTDGQKLLGDHGFVCTRQSHMMGIDLHEDLPPPQFPASLRLVTMAEHPVLRDFVRVYQETFKDHRGAVDEPLDAAVARWERIIAGGSYRPEHFILVQDGDADAAVLIMAEKSEEDPDKAWVQTLGVMPEYRRQGLATQLLFLAFQLARAMGRQRVGLMVDASSLTGANKLYDKVGMTVQMIYNAYELEIRPGVELTKQ
jgi:mycothiol synthase